MTAEAMAQTVIDARAQEMATTGGFGLERDADKDGVARIVATTFCGYFGMEVSDRFEDLFEQCAYLAEHIARDHVFLDGNKRTAVRMSLSILAMRELSSMWTIPPTRRETRSTNGCRLLSRGRLTRVTSPSCSGGRRLARDDLRPLPVLAEREAPYWQPCHIFFRMICHIAGRGLAPAPGLWRFAGYTTLGIPICRRCLAGTLSGGGAAWRGHCLTRLLLDGAAARHGRRPDLIRRRVLARCPRRVTRACGHPRPSLGNGVD